MADLVVIADLVLDYSLYPRTELNNVHVADLMQALRAGATLPPVVVDRESKRVVDGFHRLRATRRVDGDAASIAVEWRDYKDDGALYLDALRLNAGHGQKFARFDQVRAAIRAGELKLEPVQVAAALSLTVERVEELMLTRTAIGPDAELMPLKRTAGAWAGRHVSEQQREANRVASGMSPLFYLRQVINLIEGGLLDLEDIPTVLRLRELRDRILKLDLRLVEEEVVQA